MTRENKLKRIVAALHRGAMLACEAEYHKAGVVLDESTRKQIENGMRPSESRWAEHAAEVLAEVESWS